MRLAYSFANGRAIADDGEMRREPEWNEERQPDDDAPEHDGVIEVREREDGRVVPRRPERTERGRVDQQPVANAVEEGIEHEPDGHKDSPREHPRPEGHVEHGEKEKD